MSPKRAGASMTKQPPALPPDPPLGGGASIDPAGAAGIEPTGAAAGAAGAAVAAPAAEPAGGAQQRPNLGKLLIESIMEGNSAVVTTLAIITAIVVGGLLIAFTSSTVLTAWGSFFSSPGNAIAQA